MVPCPVPNLKCLFESKLSLVTTGGERRREKTEEKLTHKGIRLKDWALVIS